MSEWKNNLDGYNPSALTPNKTLLEHIQDLEAEIEKIKPEAEDTKVFVKNQFNERIDFKEDPQTQLDNHAKSIAGNIEGIARTNERVDDNLTNIALLNADKQNFATDKHDGNLNVGTIQEFHDYFYELRKSPTRTYQYEVSDSVNINLMEILGWPNGNGKSAFIYVNLPYSEAGGFEIDITYMERNGSPIYKRTMTSTLNANWKDTGWDFDLDILASKVETNTSEISKKLYGSSSVGTTGIQIMQNVNHKTLMIIGASGKIEIYNNTDNKLLLSIEPAQICFIDGQKSIIQVLYVEGYEVSTWKNVTLRTDTFNADVVVKASNNLKVIEIGRS